MEEVVYPSVCKPWLKYYSEEALNVQLPECSMYEYFYRNSKAYLSDVALVYFGKKITYTELFSNIKKIALHLHNLGVSKGDVVTIMSMQTPETIACIYALNYLGATANLVYITVSSQELLCSIKNTESKALIILNVALPKTEEIKNELNVPVVIVSVSDSMPAALKFGYNLKNKIPKNAYCRITDILSNNEIESDPSSDSSLPAVIVYTSGTTGQPKGVMLSSYNLNSLAIQCTVAGKHYKHNETTLLYLPPFTGYGIAMLHLALVFGVKITLQLKLDAESLIKAFKKTKPNRIAAGPSFMDAFLNSTSGDLSYFYDCTGGGDSLSKEKEEEINQFLLKHNSKAKYTTGYGMTELASAVCMQMNQIYKPGSLGIPLPKANIKIVDTKTKEELGIGQTGEMCFSAPNIMLGYYNNPSATEDVIELDVAGNRWIHTGDLGYVDEDGFVFFKGRMKRISLVKDSNGTVLKLFPERIEELFEQQPHIVACGVIVRPDNERLNKSIAFIEKDNDISEGNAISMLSSIAQEWLPEHLRPSEILVVNKMPLTEIGKIDYGTLEKGLTHAL